VAQAASRRQVQKRTNAKGIPSGKNQEPNMPARPNVANSLPARAHRTFGGPAHRTMPGHPRIHPQFVHISSTGKWIDRAQYLHDWKTGFVPNVIVYWDYRNEKITVIGTTALVRSVNKYTFVKEGKEITAMSQYTDTYVKESGIWRCIQAQITNVAPENYPGDETIVKKYVRGVMH
jgi:hypothetical protein